MIALHPESSFVGERDLHRLSNEGRVHFMGVGGCRHVRAGRALRETGRKRLGV